MKRVPLLGLLALALPAWAADEASLREQVRQDTVQAFVTSDFVTLEARAAEYRVQQSRTPSGKWKLSLFYGSLRSAIITETEDAGAWDQIQHRVDAWRRLYPSSPAACIADAEVSMRHAWSIRGSGYADEVQSSAWAPFHETVAAADRKLDACRSFGRNDPYWYDLKLEAARLADDMAGMRRIAGEAFSRFPYFTQNYYDYAYFALLPKWGGDLGQIEPFADQAVRRTRKLEGASLYARIYWTLRAEMLQSEDPAAYDKLIAWDKVRAGMADVVALYPDQWNIEHFAAFACMQQDYPTAQRYLDMMSGPLVKDAWTSPEQLAACRRAIRQHREPSPPPAGPDRRDLSRPLAAAAPPPVPSPPGR